MVSPPSDKGQRDEPLVGMCCTLLTLKDLSRLRDVDSSVVRLGGGLLGDAPESSD